MTLHEVLDKVLDSRDTDVGGGSASAIAGAMAAGLLGMVARLSLKGDNPQKNCGLSDETYTIIANECDEIAAALKAGAVTDTQSFVGIKAAFKLPKGTEEEKLTRAQAVEAAAFEAAAVPLSNARLAYRLLEICAALEGRSNALAASDIDCAVMFSKSAVIGCILNVEANLPLIKKDVQKKEKLLSEALNLKEKAKGVSF